MSCCTPNSRVIPGKQSPILERSLLVNQRCRNIRRSIIWGSMNFLLMCLILYDLSYTCPLYVHYYIYAEYTVVTILAINIVYHLFNFVKYTYIHAEPALITLEQKRLLGIKDEDPNYKILDNTARSPASPTYSSTPMNTSAVSWTSQGESINLSLSSPSWTYLKGSPNHETLSPFKKSSPLKISFHDPTPVDHITNEDSLNKFLKEYEETEKINKMADKTQNTTNLLSSFWSHPVTKTAKDVSTFLKKCQYQLSTQLPTKLTSGSPNSKDDKTISPSQASALEVWTRINVDSVALTQWNKNLRTWISQTILERLVSEFDIINESLEKHGLSDIKIGRVGLERLRKTSQTVPISHFIPSLGALLPFLEVTTNQEYLVKRIRELAKGGCMSEFKWNGGGSYNGKPWDESLPTDCKIVMHLLATYLDTQLMPLPNMPDTKAFSGQYYIKITDKTISLKPDSLFIQEVSEKPPHYRVVVGQKVYEMVKGYNNLFHSILFFLYHVNKVEQGMLGRVNLGRAGLNMQWIIDK